MNSALVERLRELLAKATPGPWQIEERELPHYLKGEFHTERAIFTVWHHPQLKGPLPVVGQSIGIGETKDAPAIKFTHINAGDAALIVEAHNALPALLDELDTLRTRLAGGGDDGRRLDYMIQHGFCVKRMGDTEQFMLTDSTGYPCTGGEYDTPREAIDAALNSQQTGEGE